MDNRTYASLEHLLLNGDGIGMNDSKHSSNGDGDGDGIRTDHPLALGPLGDLVSTATSQTQSDEPDSADDVVTKLLKEHRQQMGDVEVDTDDLNDQEDEVETTRRHRQEHAELIRQLAASSSSLHANMLLKQQQQQQQQQEDDIVAVVNRQLSSSFGDGPDYEEPTHDHHQQNNMESLQMSNDNGSIHNMQQLHHHHHQDEQPDDNDEEDDELSSPPRICRICHKMDDRPVIRFAPVEYDMNVVAAAPHVQTFPLDICVHVFCGKTASILPNVNQPEYEILTKAGIKNKHGIGGEVNAALSRTRCAILPTDVGNVKEKQFYLVREFEAHLAAIRGYIQTNQQQQQHPNRHHQQQLLIHQSHFNSSLPSITIPPPLAPPQQPHQNVSNGLNSVSDGVLNTSSLNDSYLQQQQQYNLLSQPTQPMAATSSSTSASQVMAAMLTPTNSNSNQYSQLLQQLSNATNGPMNHQSMSNNNMATLDISTAAILGSPSGHASQQQQLQQQSTLSNLMLNSVSALDQLYASSIGNSNDILNINQSSSNNTGSPTLEQLELLLQQQQQIQQQQNNSAASSLLTNQSNYSSTAVSLGTKKTIPVKAGNTHSKYQSSPQIHTTATNSIHSDFKVYCECGGTHLSVHTTKGVASYRNHLSTKRHQKYVTDQEQMRLEQIISSSSSSTPSMINHNSNNIFGSATNNSILPYTSSTTTQPLLSNSSMLLGQNQFNSFTDASSNNNANSHSSDNNNYGGNSSCNSSVHGAAV